MYSHDAFRQQLADNFLRHKKIAVVFRQGICHIKFSNLQEQIVSLKKRPRLNSFSIRLIHITSRRVSYATGLQRP